MGVGRLTLFNDQVVADFHIHSPLSRGVSKNLTLKLIAEGSQRKGISLIGTGDAICKSWNRNLQRKLVEVNEGIYQLKNNEKVYFITSGEIEDKERIHHLIILPDIKTGYYLFDELSKRDKIKPSKYNGRPRVELYGYELLELVKKYNCLMGPAHAFTPFTSIFRENRYYSLKGCYKGLRPDFIELGLSANSKLADQIEELRQIPFLTNSDSHSAKPNKIGREVNIISMPEISFTGLSNALKNKNNYEIKMNIGIDPRLGKYYHSFCYKCRRRIAINDDIKNESLNYDDNFLYVHANEENFLINIANKKERCPVCNGLLKLGVKDRISLISKNVMQEKGNPSPPEIDLLNKDRPKYLNSVPLTEIIAYTLKIKNPESTKVMKEYHRLISLFYNEINILAFSDIEDVIKANPMVGEIIAKMRKDELTIVGGGGGHYGHLI